MQNKVKILFVITKGNWGGAQKYVYELACRLPQETYTIHVAHGSGDMLPTKLKEVGVQTIFLPALERDVNILKDISSFFALITLFRKDRPDIVHLNSSKIGALGAIAARIARIPKIVFTVHGFAFDEDRPWIQKMVITIISWITILFSTDVICISQKEYNRASRWIGTKGKLHLIYNGISIPNFLSREQARQELFSHQELISENVPHTIIIGTIGELTNNKGYHYALEALQHIQNIYYIIIGTGEQKEDLGKTIHQLHLSEKVYLAGFIPDASKYIPAFDVFLLPSLKEGVPFVLLEAGLAEVPIVATSVGGIPEVIEHKETGFLVSPQSSTSIQETLQKVITDEKMRKDAASKLKSVITTKFSVDNMVNQTLKVYKL